MTNKTTKWEDRGFTDKYHYANWLYFNDLTDDSKMYDDVYYDEYSGKMVDVNTSEIKSDEDPDVSEDEDY